MPRFQKKKGLFHAGPGKRNVSAQQSISVHLKVSSILSKKWRSIASTLSKISRQSPLSLVMICLFSQSHMERKVRERPNSLNQLWVNHYVILKGNMFTPARLAD